MALSAPFARGCTVDTTESLANAVTLRGTIGVRPDLVWPAFLSIVDLAQRNFRTVVILLAGPVPGHHCVVAIALLPPA